MNLIWDEVVSDNSFVSLLPLWVKVYVSLKHLRISASDNISIVSLIHKPRRKIIFMFPSFLSSTPIDQTVTQQPTRGIANRLVTWTRNSSLFCFKWKLRSKNGRFPKIHCLVMPVAWLGGWDCHQFRTKNKKKIIKNPWIPIYILPSPFMFD